MIGFGKIGQRVAEKANPLLGNITVFDPCVSHDQAEKIGVKKIDNLKEGLKKADIVSLHLPYREELRHIINSESLRDMKRSAFLVNMARGAHVDSDALNEALNNNEIAGAALDVVENELDVEKGDFSHQSIVIQRLFLLLMWDGMVCTQGALRVLLLQRLQLI